MIVLLAAVLIAIFGTLGLAKLAAVPAMRSAAAHLGFTATQYRGIGALEVAGAAGIALGLFAIPLGFAAAVGLLLLMLGAAHAHRQRGDSLLRVSIPLVLAMLVAGYATADLVR